MHSGFVIMQDRLKFEIGRLHFGRHIAGMVLLLHLTNFSKFQVMDKHVAFLKNICRPLWRQCQEHGRCRKKNSVQTGTFEKIEHQ